MIIRVTLLSICLTGCSGIAGTPNQTDTTARDDSDGDSDGDSTGDNNSASGDSIGGDGTANGDPAQNPGDTANTSGDDAAPGDTSTPDRTECTNWQTAHPAWIWCDDFEAEQTMNVNYNDVSTNGMAITTEDSFSGSYGLRQHYDVDQVDAGWVSKFYADALGNDYGPIHDKIYARWYHKFEAGFEGMPPKMARIRSLGPSWDKRFSVLHWVGTNPDNYQVVADVSVPLSSQANSSGWLPVMGSDFHYADAANIGRWVCHEMYIDNNTSGIADGAYRFWADDRMIIENTGVDLRGTSSFNFNQVMLDTYWNGGSPKAQNRYFDNFVISTQRIGCIP